MAIVAARWILGNVRLYPVHRQPVDRQAHFVRRLEVHFALQVVFQDDLFVFPAMTAAAASCRLDGGVNLFGSPPLQGHVDVLGVQPPLEDAGLVLVGLRVAAWQVDPGPSLWRTLLKKTVTYHQKMTTDALR